MATPRSLPPPSSSTTTMTVDVQIPYKGEEETMTATTTTLSTTEQQLLLNEQIMDHNEANTMSTTTTTTTSTNSGVIDNPCWGSPTRCDLQDLLHVLQQQQQQARSSVSVSSSSFQGSVDTTPPPPPPPPYNNNHNNGRILLSPPPPPNNNTTTTTTTGVILYNSTEYIVLNKPPDVRMDGDFPSTVTKLLLYEYPSPSLLLRRLVPLPLPVPSLLQQLVPITTVVPVVVQSQQHVLPTTMTTALSDVNHREPNNSATTNTISNETKQRTITDRTPGLVDVGNNGIKDAGDTTKLAVSNAQHDGTDANSMKTATTTMSNALTTKTTSTTFTTEQLQLLRRISTISRFCDVPDNELRPCHQLDYATSGVLLIARSKQTASRAVRAFEDRNVHKMYTAMVLGHIQIPDNSNNANENRYYNKASIEQCGGDPANDIHHWSYVTLPILQATMGQLEYRYRKSRHRQNKVTFHGYFPEQEIFSRWQDRERAKLKNEISKPSTSTQHDAHTTRKDKHIISSKKRSIEWDTVFEEVDRLSFDVKHSIVNSKWKELKKSENDSDCAIVTKFQEAAKQYNDMARNNIAPQKSAEKATIDEALPTLPTFFRVNDDEVRIDNGHDTKSSTTANKNALSSFYVFAPLAQDDGTNNFSMLLHPNQHTLCSYLPVGDPTVHDYKPSLTKCTIVHHSYYYYYNTATEKRNTVNDNDGTTIPTGANEMVKVPVTIVQLEPRTGRRHQLRIHTALLGHPIAGDATYCDSTNTNDTTTGSSSSSSSRERTIVDRLCLHSTRLHIPNLMGDKTDLNITCDSPFRYCENNNGDDDRTIDTNFVTIDAI